MSAWSNHFSQAREEVMHLPRAPSPAFHHADKREQIRNKTRKRPPTNTRTSGIDQDPEAPQNRSSPSPPRECATLPVRLRDCQRLDLRFAFAYSTSTSASAAASTAASTGAFLPGPVSEPTSLTAPKQR